MSIGIDFEDFGFDPIHTSPVLIREPVKPAGRSLVAGSVLAQALLSVWEGNSITAIDSPPGAGKTTLIVELVAILKERTNLKIVIACVTNRAAQDMASRIAAELGYDSSGLPQVIFSSTTTEAPEGVAKGGREFDGLNLPTVRTVASCKMSPPECDVMIIDEAYQATFSDVSAAADQADQVLLVGDPGQIGPVVTADLSAFRGRDVAPHMRAPEVFANMEDAVILELDTTYRLGAETVEAIAPLYNFGFSSSRPDRYVTDAHGNRVSEVLSLEVPVAKTFDSLDTLVKVAEYATSLVGVQLVKLNEETGELTDRVLEEEDICIVVAHNSQSSGITAILRTMDVEGITVLTADKAQGGQWHAVVALDPCVGYTAAGSHQLSTGRLCVMASRHMTHLTWVHDGQWESVLADPDIDQKEAAIGLSVRRNLTSI